MYSPPFPIFFTFVSEILGTHLPSGLIAFLPISLPLVLYSTYTVFPRGYLVVQPHDATHSFGTLSSIALSEFFDPFSSSLLLLRSSPSLVPFPSFVHISSLFAFVPLPPHGSSLSAIFRHGRQFGCLFFLPLLTPFPLPFRLISFISMVLPRQPSSASPFRFCGMPAVAFALRWQYGPLRCQTGRPSGDPKCTFPPIARQITTGLIPSGALFWWRWISRRILSLPFRAMLRTGGHRPTH